MDNPMCSEGDCYMVEMERITVLSSIQEGTHLRVHLFQCPACKRLSVEYEQGEDIKEVE